MFYSFMIDESNMLREGKVIMAFRYDTAKKIVTIVGDRAVVDRYAMIFNGKRPTIGWLAGKNSDNPLYSALGNSPGFRHYPKGEGQEEFLSAMSDLEGKATKNISVEEKPNGNGKN
jgi:hypothetical protein